MKRPFFLVLFAGVLSAAPAYAAGEATYEQRLARGIAAVETGDLPAAEGEFREVLKERPGDPTATLYLGIALSRAGKGEAESALKSALEAAPNDPRASYEMGVHYFQAGMYTAAVPYLEKTVALSKDTPLGGSARNYLDAIPGRGAAKRWGVDLSGGLQYDTNVVLSPTNMPLPQGITRKSSWREVLLFRGRYGVFSGEKGDLSIGDRFYQGWNNQLPDFNMTQNVADLSGGVRLSPRVMARGVYSFEADYLGGDRYAILNLLVPSLVISEGPGWFTTLEYKWRKDNFYDGPTFDNNSDRTGTWQSAGLAQDLPLWKGTTARAGYAYEWDDARADWWSYRNHRGFAELVFELPRRTFLDLKGEYQDVRYDAAYPGYGVARKDAIWFGSAVAGIHLTDRYTVFAGYAYTDESSNIPAFSYTRGVTSLFLNARF